MTAEFENNDRHCDMVYTDDREEGNLEQKDLVKESGTRAGPPLYGIKDEYKKNTSVGCEDKETVNREQDREETSRERR